MDIQGHLDANPEALSMLDDPSGHIAQGVGLVQHLIDERVLDLERDIREERVKAAGSASFMDGLRAVIAEYWNFRAALGTIVFLDHSHDDDTVSGVFSGATMLPGFEETPLLSPITIEDFVVSDEEEAFMAAEAAEAVEAYFEAEAAERDSETSDKAKQASAPDQAQGNRRKKVSRV